MFLFYGKVQVPAVESGLLPHSWGLASVTGESLSSGNLPMDDAATQVSSKFTEIQLWTIQSSLSCGLTEKIARNYNQHQKNSEYKYYFLTSSEHQYSPLSAPEDICSELKLWDKIHRGVCLAETCSNCAKKIAQQTWVQWITSLLFPVRLHNIRTCGSLSTEVCIFWQASFHTWPILCMQATEEKVLKRTNMFYNPEWLSIKPYLLTVSTPVLDQQRLIWNYSFLFLKKNNVTQQMQLSHF